MNRSFGRQRDYVCYTSSDESRHPTAQIFNDPCGHKTLCLEVERVKTHVWRDNALVEEVTPTAYLTIHRPRTRLDRLLGRDGLVLSVTIDDPLDLREMTFLLESVLGWGKNP